MFEVGTFPISWWKLKVSDALSIPSEKGVKFLATPLASSHQFGIAMRQKYINHVIISSLPHIELCIIYDNVV